MVCGFVRGVFVKKSGGLVRWVKDEIGKQLFSFVGFLLSFSMILYNEFKPTSVSLVGQSGLGGGESVFLVSLGLVGLFVLFVSLVIFLLVALRKDG